LFHFFLSFLGLVAIRIFSWASSLLFIFSVRDLLLKILTGSSCTGSFSFKEIRLESGWKGVVEGNLSFYYLSLLWSKVEGEEGSSSISSRKDSMLIISLELLFNSSIGCSSCVVPDSLFDLKKWDREELLATFLLLPFFWHLLYIF